MPAVLVLLAGALCLLAMATSVAVGPVWALLLLSSLWLPANNRHFEGPVVLTLVRNHGVTVSDLGGVAAFLLATGILVRRSAAAPRQPGGPWLVLAYCCIAFGLGAAAAWATG